jgi:tetratricopeptide (TPR) repeat protein
MASATLRRALALHQAGRLKEAEAGYRQALAEQPGNPDALHFLGLVAHQSGRHEDAIDLIRQAIAVRRRPVFSYNLAQVYLAQNKAAAAEEALRQTIADAPDHAEALFHLGGLLRARDDIPGAIESYRRTIAAKPGFVDAHVNLGLLLKEVGDTAMAVGHLQVADRLRPNDPRILSNLGMVREQIAQSDALQDSGGALALDVRSAPAAIRLAGLLRSVARHGEAIAVLEATLSAIGDDADLHMLLASTCAEANRTEEAITHYEKAAAAEPRATRALIALGNLHRQAGQFERAHDCYQRALELDPENCDALVDLLRHLKSSVPEQEIARIATRANDPMLPTERRRQLHFALSQYREEAGEFDAAFHHMKEGNLLRRLELERKSRPYQPDNQTASVNRTMEVFDASYFRRVADFGLDSELPVFIVGMPRSGTTLCEQILASHSQVFGADELPDIALMARGLERQFAKQSGRAEDLAYVAHLTKDGVRSIAEQHLERLRSLAPGAARVVDKLLSNYHRLGLIATLFPRARIIYCRRDPLDMGLSCYSRDFASMPVWASDLWAIGHVCRECERLIAHWRRVLPIPIFELVYEDVVADLEGSARRLVDYCGLEWESRCLEFHRTDRQVRTASLEQVRRPIYDNSIGRWRKFERHLAPLREALNRRLP